MSAKTVLPGVGLLVSLGLAAPAAAQFRTGPQVVQPPTPVIVPAPRYPAPATTTYPALSGATYIPYVGYYLPNPAPRPRVAHYIPPWSAETATTPEPNRNFVPPADDSAWITVRVPADAAVWFDGVQVKATGGVRKFRTPVLKQGSLYTYQVKARWGPAGHPVSQTQPVMVTAGSDVSVAFTPPAGKAP